MSPADIALVAEIGANLRHTRQRRNLTQRELATRAGIDPKHLSTIERGQTAPTILTLIHLTQVLNIPVTALWDTPDPY